MDKKRQRVLVSLTDSPRRAGPLDDIQFDNDVKILDNRTVLLRINNAVHKKKTEMSTSNTRYYRQLEFDAVGFEYESHLRNEITDFVHRTFKEKKNTCFVRFSPHRMQNLNLMTRLLISEVDKSLSGQRLRLKTINLEFYDVRKFEMINMLNNQTTNARNRDSLSGRTMQSTREIFQWLLSEYSVLRSRCVGDDYIDLEFVLTDVSLKRHSIHMSIFQVFGIDGRLDIMSFVKTLGEGKNPSNSLVTDCIKESFDWRRPTDTLLLFEMPLTKECRFWLRKMLHLADAAYTSINMAMRRKSQDCLTPRSSDETLKSHSPLHSKTNVTSKSKMDIKVDCRSVSDVKLNGKSKSEIKVAPKQKDRTPPCMPIGMRRRINCLSTQDYNNLAHWYSRIDTKMHELREHMQKYYTILYQNKMNHICWEFRCMEDEINETGESGDSGDHELAKTTKKKDEQEAFAKYKEMLNQFRNLEDEVEKTAFSNTLKVYLSTKTYELTNEEKKLKQRELENLRQNIINFFKSDKSEENEESS